MLVGKSQKDKMTVTVSKSKESRRKSIDEFKVPINFWQNLEKIIEAFSSDIQRLLRVSYQEYFTAYQDFLAIYEDFLAIYEEQEEKEETDLLALEEINQGMEMTLYSIWSLFDQELLGTLCDERHQLAMSALEKKQLSQTSKRIFGQLKTGVSFDVFQILISTYRQIIEEVFHRIIGDEIKEIDKVLETFTKEVECSQTTSKQQKHSDPVQTTVKKPLSTFQQDQQLEKQLKWVLSLRVQEREWITQLLAYAMRLHLYRLSINSAEDCSLQSAFLDLLNTFHELPQEIKQKVESTSFLSSIEFYTLTPCRIKIYREVISQADKILAREEKSASAQIVEDSATRIIPQKQNSEKARVGFNRDPLDNRFFQQLFDKPACSLAGYYRDAPREISLRQPDVSTKQFHGIDPFVKKDKKQTRVKPDVNQLFPLVLPRALEQQLTLIVPAWYQWDQRAKQSAAYRFSDEYLSLTVLRKRFQLAGISKMVFVRLHRFNEHEFSTSLPQSDRFVNDYFHLLNSSIKRSFQSSTIWQRLFFPMTDQFCVDWQYECIMEYRLVLQGLFEEILHCLENYRRWLMLASISQSTAAGHQNSIQIETERAALMNRMSLLCQFLKQGRLHVRQYQRTINFIRAGKLLPDNFEDAFFQMEQQLISHKEKMGAMELQYFLKYSLERDKQPVSRLPLESTQAFLTVMIDDSRKKLSAGELLSQHEAKSLYREAFALDDAARRRRFLQCKTQHDEMIDKVDNLLSCFIRKITTLPDKPVEESMDLYEINYITHVVSYFCALKERRMIDTLRSLIEGILVDKHSFEAKTQRKISEWLQDLGTSYAVKIERVERSKKEAMTNLHYLQKDYLRLMVNWPLSVRESLSNCLETAVVEEPFENSTSGMARLNESLTRNIHALASWPTIAISLARDKHSEVDFFKLVTALVKYYRIIGECTKAHHQLSTLSRQMITPMTAQPGVGLFSVPKTGRIDFSSAVGSVERPSIPRAVGSFSELI